MKILILGKNGQVGWELQRALAPLGEVVALDRSGHDTNPILCGDLGNLEGLRQTIAGLKPDVIVNAAAYTAVDKAENESELAHLINGQAPKILAEEAKKINALLVHYSTDYVFSGKGEAPWYEKDEPAPVNQYGQSKLEGEQVIQESGCKYLIFRTSWVYAAKGNNFAKTMLRLASERQSLSVINDQVGAPTGAALIADCTAHAVHQSILNSNLLGLYHLTASGQTTWYEYAKLVIEHAQSMGIKLAVEEVVAITTADYPTPATRPHNSRLDATKFCKSFNLILPQWQDGVIRMLNDINS